MKVNQVRETKRCPHEVNEFEWTTVCLAVLSAPCILNLVLFIFRCFEFTYRTRILGCLSVQQCASASARMCVRERESVCV